jgi:2-acylglycerol O-acyltransferase 2
MVITLINFRHRRLETASVTLWMSFLPLLLGSFVFLTLHSGPYFPIIIAYLIYIALDPSPELGNRKSMFFRDLTLWKYMRDYFPMKLVKTVDLDPSKNYIFGYHPHGIISLGAWVNFGTDANFFSHIFTGIDLHLMTLGTNFNMPFIREILLSMGMMDVSKNGCYNALQGGPGKSIMIVVGGANEVVFARPGVNDIIIKKRLGFVKLALKTGNPLVPVFSFGETDIWDQFDNPEGSKLRIFQDKVRKATMFNPPALRGRGIFTYNYGILPFRRNVTSVVGRPVDVPHIENPTLEQVLFYQQKYIDELQHVYDTYKDEYLPNRKSELNFRE